MMIAVMMIVAIVTMIAVVTVMTDVGNMIIAIVMTDVDAMIRTTVIRETITMGFANKTLSLPRNPTIVSYLDNADDDLSPHTGRTVIFNVWNIEILRTDVYRP